MALTGVRMEIYDTPRQTSLTKLAFSRTFWFYKLFTNQNHDLMTTLTESHELNHFFTEKSLAKNG